MRESSLSFYQRYIVKQAQIIGYILQRENDEQDFTNYYNALVALIQTHHPEADKEEIRQFLSHSLLDFTEKLFQEPEGIRQVERMYSRDIFREVKPFLMKRLHET